MIPLEIDIIAILADLKTWGWKDLKIESACGFSRGYIDKMREGPRPHRPYQHAARLYNFWCEEKVSAERQTKALAST